MTSIHITAQENGVGLSRDVRLLTAALRETGCEVEITNIEKPERRRRRSIIRQWGVRTRHWWDGSKRLERQHRFDINVMLESIWPERLDLARFNVLVPNPEWFDKHDGRLLPTVDRIWAKTEMARAIFDDKGRPTTLIGFDSEDRFQADVSREPTFFHLAGKSSTKGTSRLLALWSHHPEWPKLTVVQSRNPDAPPPVAKNIVVRQEYIADDELKQLQNANAFHLCPSETEGWGHYLVEGLSVGAIVITLDAAPMNELVAPDRGVLAPAKTLGRRRLATTYSFDEAALALSIVRVIQMSDSERRAMSEAARAWFVANKQGFAQRVRAGIDAVLNP